jgi:tetratricopeptide (TPR) repeat protein
MEQQKDYAAPLLNLAIITHQQLNNRPLALEKYRQYLALRPRAPNWAEIEKVANQLELQMHAAGPAAGRVPAPVDQSRTSRSNPPPTYASASRDASVARPTGSVSTPGPTGSVATRRDAEINILPAPRETNIARRIDPRTPTQVPDSGPTIGSPGASGRTNEIARAARPTAVPRYARYSYLSPRPARTGDRPAADRYFNEGLRAQRAGQLPRAILAYQRATRFDPSYFEAHFNLGAAAFQNRNWREALTAYEYALAVRPDSADARYNFALALKQANHPWEAVAELEKLLQSRPQEVRLHLALANIHFQQLNQIDSARQHYQRALQLDPRHAEAAKVRAWLSEH